MNVEEARNEVLWDNSGHLEWCGTPPCFHTEALDQLILAVQAEMPCYNANRDAPFVTNGDCAFHDLPLCPSCTARIKQDEHIDSARYSLLTIIPSAS